MNTYTLEELVMLGRPIRLDLDETPCDRYGCDRSATVLVPGAALCDHCRIELRVDPATATSDYYDLPFAELVGGDEWREARRAQYEDRLARLPPLERSAEHDRHLDELAAQSVDALVASAFEPR